MNARHLSRTLDWRLSACGAPITERDYLPTTNEDAVECKACLHIIGERGNITEKPITLSDYMRAGVGVPTPLHTPPNMDDDGDGVFTFYDTHHGPDEYMTVIPQTTGNVEITTGGGLFTLSHLDRADLIRALLHDFHYSPERGGPNDD